MAAGDVAIEIMAIFTRWTRRTLRQPMFLFFALLQPVLFFVLFTQAFSAMGRLAGFQGTSFLTYYSSTVVLQTVLTSSMQAGLGFVQDLESGFMDKLKAAPIRRSSILFGKVLADALRVVIQVVIILAICAVLGVTFREGILGALLILVMAVIFGIAWSGISTFVALATKNTEATFMVAMITTFPLLFLSTSVMPKSELPPWIQAFSAVNPISYLADAYHDIAIYGYNWGTIGAAFGMSILVGILTLSATTWMFRRAVKG